MSGMVLCHRWCHANAVQQVVSSHVLSCCIDPSGQPPIGCAVYQGWYYVKWCHVDDMSQVFCAMPGHAMLSEVGTPTTKCVATSRVSRHPPMLLPFLVVLQVVLSTSVLEDVESLDQLERILRRKSAAMVAALTGYQLALPVGFRDYSVVGAAAAAAAVDVIAKLQGFGGLQ